MNLNTLIVGRTRQDKNAQVRFVQVKQNLVQNLTELDSQENKSVKYETAIKTKVPRHWQTPWVLC